MDLTDDPCIIVQEDGERCPGSLRTSDIFYCDAKGKVCLTGCEYCRNTCPCLSRMRGGTGRYK